ncbi:MAG: histidinol dehydrogenase [Candidatus Hydrothermarchaeota archaeon]|jgi:histidinol dehydrogenase|nr:histidinol dehydrogenase [Candidatus Hydrothermarchaeota archaeon]
MKFFRLRELSREDIAELVDRSEDLEEVYPVVRDIIEDVKSRGDEALRYYSRKFDDAVITDLRVRDEEFKEAVEDANSQVKKALMKAIENIRAFHARQSRDAWTWEKPGVTLGQVSRPLGRVGCYIPGGRATYPSTVLMTVIPAQVAGVEEIVCVTPPDNKGMANPIVLLACDILGVREVYKVGGAQGIAALAYGTESIPGVGKIVGPGNVYVTAAKSLVSDRVAIDFPAGPSEVLIIADETANPRYIALDMLAQGEHDPRARCVLITTSQPLAEEVMRELKASSSEEKAVILVTEKVEEALDLANQYSPEHLEVLVKEPEALLEGIKNAGSIFLGEYTPVALGDYASGTNHVLPTGGMAKVYSGLSVRDFLKTMSYQKFDREALKELADVVTTLAELEGLRAHAESVRKRIEK